MGLLDDALAPNQNWVCIFDMGPIVSCDCLDALYNLAVIAVAVDNDYVVVDDSTRFFAVSLCLWNHTMIPV